MTKLRFLPTKTLARILGGSISPSPINTIQLIPFEANLRIIGFENGYWKVEYEEKTGFIFEIFVVETKEMKYFKNSNKNWKPNPTSSTNYSRRNSNTYHKKIAAQCTSYTKKGKRCMNKTKNISGKCHVHD